MKYFFFCMTIFFQIHQVDSSNNNKLWAEVIPLLTSKLEAELIAKLEAKLEAESQQKREWTKQTAKATGDTRAVDTANKQMQIGLTEQEQEKRVRAEPRATQAAKAEQKAKAGEYANPVNVANKQVQIRLVERNAEQKTKREKLAIQRTKLEAHQEDLLAKRKKELPIHDLLKMGIAPTLKTYKYDILRPIFHTTCDYAILRFEDRFPSINNTLLNKRDLALLTSSAMTATALRYNAKLNFDNNSSLPYEVSVSVLSKYVGIKTVDFTVWSVNSFTNWWEGHDVIDPESKKTKMAQSIMGTVVLLLVQSNVCEKTE